MPVNFRIWGAGWQCGGDGGIQLVFPQPLAVAESRGQPGRHLQQPLALQFLAPVVVIGGSFPIKARFRLGNQGFINSGCACFLRGRP